MNWTEAEYQKWQDRQPKTLEAIGKAHGLEPVKPSKHRNHKVTVDGITFDSKREFQRYCELQMMERKGVISALQRQVVYELIPSVVLNGRKKPAIKYIADHVYFQNGEIVVEDAKNPHLRKEPVFRIKQHLMKHVHNIDISLI